MRFFPRRRISASLLAVCVCFSLQAGNAISQSNTPDGWASVNLLGQNGTTGGDGGTIVTVTNAAEFLSYIQRLGPHVIRVIGTITLNSMVNVQSHKTIVGVGSNGVITGGGLNISKVSNVIIRNLLFEKSLDDAVNIEDGAHHVWVDHCDFTGAFDGLLDIKRGADFVTVSWNKFYNHQKTCLLGHDDNNGLQDAGHLRVTYHHNWFNGTTERHPRVRFSALTHVYNNYYIGNSYGVASTMNAEVLVEGNYFKNVGNPTHVGFAASGPGDLVERNNVYDNCPNPPQTRGEVPNPPYVYSSDNAADIPAKLQSRAGRAGYIEPITGPQWLVYDAGVLPNKNNPAFSAVNVTNAPDTTSWIISDPDISGNKLLRFIDSVRVTGKFMWGYNWKMDAGKGATFAFRVKPIDPALYQRVFEVEFRDGSIRERLFVLNGGVIELDRANVTNTLPLEPDRWYTYRITYQNGVSNVYLNEEPAPFLTGASTSANSSNDVRFGDGSDGNTHGFLLDWFVFDTTGAYSPGESQIPDSLFIDKLPSPDNWVVYDASKLPNENEPAFSAVNVTNPPDTTSWIIDDPAIAGNRLLRFIDSLRVGAKFMWGINWNMNPATGATIAFRVKPLDPAFYQRTFEVEFRDGSIRERLFVLPGGAIRLDRAAVSNTLPSAADDWHTYRITYKNGVSNVYLNEQPVAFLTGASTSTNSSNDVRFGDGSDGNTHGFLLDWFIYDNTGAFAPGETRIPESLFVDKTKTRVEAKADAAPLRYALEQNYPNPFNPVTKIDFQLPKSGRVKIAVYNAVGQLVATLLDENMERGRHSIAFDAGKLSTGIYLYRIASDDFIQVKKMMVVR